MPMVPFLIPPVPKRKSLKKKENVIGDVSSSSEDIDNDKDDKEEQIDTSKHHNDVNKPSKNQDTVVIADQDDSKFDEVKEESKMQRKQSVKDKLIRRMSYIPDSLKDDRSMAMRNLLMKEIMSLKDQENQDTDTTFDRLSSSISQLEDTVGSRRDTLDKSDNGDYIEELGIFKKTDLYKNVKLFCK